MTPAAAWDAAFHPVVRQWFIRHLGAPTAVQDAAWPVIAERQSTLITAPTGTGKTLAAFMTAINDLLQQGLAGDLPQSIQVLYVSPLKALSNDIQKNLQQPLNGIRDQLLESGLPDVPLQAWVRTGDTSASERQRMRRQPPHILVTTPESLYALLTSASGREQLQHVRTVIVDEIHALAGNKRGAHLMLSLERLAALCQRHHGQEPLRIGLSATQKPIERIADFLMGSCRNSCRIVDVGHTRQRDLALQLTASPLTAVMPNEVWEEIYDRLQTLISEHRTTLIFVNTRRLAERVAHHLAQRLGEASVTAHHGSLSRKHRLHAEQRLKQGQLRALVATASLELGIDIGEIDLVCQLGSPRAIATFLQRVGRSGHRLGATPKGRLFPLSREELLECIALLAAIKRDELDTIAIPAQPLDVLAQQIIAEVAGAEWNATALYETVRRAWPYRDLTRADFSAVVRMLTEGYSTRRGRRGAYLFYDSVHDQLRSRRGARLVALTNGGAIPDQFDYDVILQPEGALIGTLNEDFAFESMPGEIFQLGNNAYRIHKIEQGRVYVEDAHGQPPTIPFWFGEAPGRTVELSSAVAGLLAQLETPLSQDQLSARQHLIDQLAIEPNAAAQLCEYLEGCRQSLGRLPTQDDIVIERFFDAAGDMHVVIHSVYGTRLNRAWGLALRKRFCRKFNFELQAAATDNHIILSLGATHSFPLHEVVAYLHSNSLRQVLIQAVLDAPMFATRWRWNSNISLAVVRYRNGKRVPATFQRSDAEDLIALVFPDQLACLENIAGDRNIPDHPLVQQTLHDCLHDTMDVNGLEQLYQRIETGKVKVHCYDLTAASPFSAEIIHARPYAFLDDGAAEERRTLNIRDPRSDDLSDLPQRQLDAELIRQFVHDIWPQAGSADELHDAIVMSGFLTHAECRQPPHLPDYPEVQRHWPELLETLCKQQRVIEHTLDDGQRVYVAAERDREFRECPTNMEALHAILRSRLELLGPTTTQSIAQSMALPDSQIQQALLHLEQQGFVVRGRVAAEHRVEHWCERGLLARLHRLHQQQRRRAVSAVSPQQFMRFLFDWQHLSQPRQGGDALSSTLEQLEGYALPAAVWEQDVLAARLQPYLSFELDQLCSSGRWHWQRVLNQPAPARKRQLLRSTPIAFYSRRQRRAWQRFTPQAHATISASAQTLLTHLQQNGASFFDELQQDSGFLRSQLEDALAELIAGAHISADNFHALRALMTRHHPRWRKRDDRRRQRLGSGPLDDAGRWSCVATKAADPAGPETDVEYIARVLLKRYGVVFRKVLERETHLPPWRDLLYALRRLEARDEILAGRFVSGFSGEQFALPEAAIALQQLRGRADDARLYCISAADPLNLTAIFTPSQRITAKTTLRIVYRNGLAVAYGQHRDFTPLTALSEQEQWEIRHAFLHPRHTALNSSNPAVQ